MIYKLLSERMKPSPLPNILITEYVPEKVRNQIRFRLEHIFQEPGINRIDYDELIYGSIENYSFTKGEPIDQWICHDPYELMLTMNDQDYLDLLDIICHTALNDIEFKNMYGAVFRESINDILISNSMGFIVVNDQLIPCTDICEAEEIIIPAYNTMAQLGMTEASRLLDEAYEHFKNRKNPEAVLSAFKAMESAIDFLMEKTSTEQPMNGGMASKLDVLSRTLGMDSYLAEDLKKIISILKISGEIRNKNAGHGSVDTVPVEDSLFKFEIDLVASSILFLARCYQNN